MGANNSRLNADGEVVPARIRPLLLRRIEELRKRRNGATLRDEGTLSKKQLLKDDATEDSASSHEDETEDKILQKEQTQLPAKEQNHVVTVDKLSKVVPLPDSEYGTEEQHNKHEDQSQEKVKDVGKKDEVGAYCVWLHPENKHEETNAKHNDHDDDHDDSDHDDGEEEDNEDRRVLGPGSPSFRIYIETEKIIKGEDKSEKQNIAVHEKSPSVDSFESAASASGNSGNSNEVVEIESTTKRKGHKMKKLGAMKRNLLKVNKKLQVKHGMNPMFSCTGSSDRKSLLSPK